MEIFRIRIPSPFPTGDTNAYLIDDEVLFDCGIYTPQSFEALKNGLEERGLTFEDVKLVVSHSHADHFGMAYLFPEVYASKIACERISDSEFSYFKLVFRHFRNLGMPEKLVEIMEKRTEERYTQYSKPCKNCNEVKEIKKLKSFEVLPAPGHSLSHICLLKDGILFSGDTVLDGIVPYKSPEPVDEVERLPVLEQYLETIERLLSIQIETVFPGHRDFRNPVIKVFLSYIDDFTEKTISFWRAYKDWRTPYDAAVEIYGFDPKFLFLIVSEAAAYTDYLHNHGFVEWMGKEVRRKGSEEELRQHWNEVKERIKRKN